MIKDALDVTVTSMILIDSDVQVGIDNLKVNFSVESQENTIYDSLDSTDKIVDVLMGG